MKAVVQIVGVTAGVLILSALYLTMPGYATMRGPITTRVPFGETGHGAAYDARLDKVRTTDVLSVEDWGKQSDRRTGGVWVVADMTITVTKPENAGMNFEWQTRGGRTYMPSDRAGQYRTWTPVAEDIGRTVPYRVIFEMPKSEVEGARLALRTNALESFASNLSMAIPPATEIEHVPPIKTTDVGDAP